MTLDPFGDGPLPIDAVLPALRDALDARAAVVLQAPPGAGKTTRVPLALLGERWLAGRKIVMLEPRRLAARAAARRMAGTLGESVGETVGFRMRGETRVGPATRIEVVTEGVLTRLLRADASLDGVGLVVFDEFHERNLYADLGLALTLQTQELLRPDLRILVMSATLDGAAVATLLGDAPVVTSVGRTFPVDVRYSGRRPEQRIEGAMAAAIRQTIATDTGGVLAFLPGVAEIRRTHELLAGAMPAGTRLHTLYGDLPADVQDAAIRSPADGERKIVLATSIAESSVTIDGVRVVIDGGLARVPRFSPRNGMTRLETVRVSRASADQRCGRAGRTTPGLCIRLWAAEEQAGLVARATPEILEADLAPLSLELAFAGVRDPATLRWLDALPAAALSQARELLVELEALDADGRITAHGRAMAEFGTHPRLAHMLLRSRDAGRGGTACGIAALLEERDVLRRDPLHRDPDLRSRLRLLAGDRRDLPPDVDRDALRRVGERSRLWREQLRVPRDERIDEDACGWLLALAFPDRVAQRRPGAAGRYLMRNGHGARVEDPGTLAAAPYLAVAELDGRVPESRIFLAAPVDAPDIERLFAPQVSRDCVVEWDATGGTIVARARERLGAILLRESPLPHPDEEAVARALMHAIRRRDGVQLAWSDGARQLRHRVAFLRRLDSTWPDWSDATLDTTLERWLLPHLDGRRRRLEVEQLDLAAILLQDLDWERRRELDRLAPTHVVVPSGSRIPVDYADPDAPVLAVRLQEVFGLDETPSVAGGRVPLTLHLLSPAHRPVQVTRDLAGFWRSSYFDVRKELRGRYPRHEWPEDPRSAVPTRRAKPRRQ